MATATIQEWATILAVAINMQVKSLPATKNIHLTTPILYESTGKAYCLLIHAHVIEWLANRIMRFINVYYGSCDLFVN